MGLGESVRVIKRFGDACGGFVAVDEETREKRLLHWVRILVKSNGKKVPRKLHVVVGVDTSRSSYGGRLHHGCRQWSPRKGAKF